MVSIRLPGFPFGRAKNKNFLAHKIWIKANASHIGYKAALAYSLDGRNSFLKSII